MAPPGRRRLNVSPLTLLLGIAFLFSSTASAASAVLGLDLGTEYIKAALVKPGIPLEIVLTKDSKRKEISAVAFKPAKSGALAAGSYPERFYGNDAVALAARFPGEVYPNLKQLLGISNEDGAVKIFSDRYPALQVVPTDGRATVSFKTDTLAEDNVFSVEELLAMELKNVKENAVALAGKGTTIEDVVFTVPPFYTVEERRALEAAARLAGLKVLAMVSDGLAVGINYATSRTFPVVNDGGKPEINLVFDMGAGSTSATVIKFQGRKVKDVGKFNKTIQEAVVVGASWDRTLGGDALNSLLVNDFISSFVNLPEPKEAGVTAQKIKSHGRTAAKLWKEAERSRQVLSANTQVSGFFEGLYEDLDYGYMITRSKFEELAESFAARIDEPINKALAAAGLKLEDVDSVIVHGGATRTPFVQNRLESLVGKAKIRSNVNSDEAAVFGAAFKAAGLSPSFRVKEIRDQDTQGYNHGIQYMFNLKDRDQKIFTPSTKVGTTKDLPFQMMGEFEFTIYQATPGAGDKDVKTPILHFKSGNLTRAVTKMIDTDGCDRDTFNNYVQVRLSPVTGIPEVTSAWVTCIAEVDKTKGGIVDGIKGFFKGGKKDQEPLKEGESSSSSSKSTKSSKSSKSSKTAKSSSSASGSSSAAGAESTEATTGEKEKKEIRSTITFQVTQKGYEKHPRKSLQKLKDRITAFDTSDRARRAREEYLNSLEAFVYKSRDYIEDESFIIHSTSELRAKLEEALSVASDWIYSDGPDAAEDVLKARLKELTDLVNPVLKRRDEATGRPAAIQELIDTVNGLESVIPMVKESIEKEAEASRIAEAAKSSSADNPTVTPVDPLAELEDDDEKASVTTTEDSPFPTDIPNPYTNEDLKLLEESVSKAQKWIEEKDAAQKKLGATDDPVLTLKDIQEQKRKIDNTMMEMMQKRLAAINSQQQKPKKAPKKPKTAKPKKAPKKKEAPVAENDAAEPSEEELAEALKKAGIKGDGIKLKSFGKKFDKVMETEDGRKLNQLELGDDATEEDILAAIDRLTDEARDKYQKEKKAKEAEGRVRDEL